MKALVFIKILSLFPDSLFGPPAKKTLFYICTNKGLRIFKALLINPISVL